MGSSVAVLTLSFAFICCRLVSSSDRSYRHPIHPSAADFLNEIERCKTNYTYCEERASAIATIISRISNYHAALLLHDTASDLFVTALNKISFNCTVTFRLAHALSSLAFSQGELAEARRYWSRFGDSDLVSQRSLAAQILIGGSESEGISYMVKYTKLLGSRVGEILLPLGILGNVTKSSEGNSFLSPLSSTPGCQNQNTTMTTSGNESCLEYNSTGSTAVTILLTRSPSTEDSEELLLNLLLGEAQGNIRHNSKLVDLPLSVSDIRSLDTKQRFRLGVGLAKLGLFDLSLRHVSMSAAPWEAPLYRWRAKLVFSPIHSSVRSLAQSVGNFARQCEGAILHKEPASPMMVPICNSLNDLALALQALPLLHLAGFASARETSPLGHSPAGLPVLLGEVFNSMCPPRPPPASISPSSNSSASAPREMDLLESRTGAAAVVLEGEKTKKKKSKGRDDQLTVSEEKEHTKNKNSSSQIVIGIVAGSFDGVIGRIVVGMLEEISQSPRRKAVSFVAMCFPTPRDAVTDRAAIAFDAHVNLNPHDKAQAIDRILAAKPDFLLFADAGLDSRVFALAHERLSRWQGLLWGWGGSMAIPTVDFFFIPRVLFDSSRCPLSVPISPQSLLLLSSGSSNNTSDTTAAAASMLSLSDYDDVLLAEDEVMYVPPQHEFAEQVVFFEGLPPLPPVDVMNHSDLWATLQSRFLLPLQNRSHLYLFPGSVKHMHPEFDAAVSLMLKTDPLAMIVLAVPRTGRDNLPTTHIAARHDLMHPTMPAAAVKKLRHRLRASVGDMVDRVRVLPPLDERLYRALQRAAVAVLDPFPVGTHVQIMEAMIDGVPVVSAPALQECTNSHAAGLARALGLRGVAAIETSGNHDDNREHNTGNEHDGNKDTGSSHGSARIEWPSTPEEYAVLALRLNSEESLRHAYTRAPDGCPGYHYSSSLSSAEVGGKRGGGGRGNKKSCVRTSTSTRKTNQPSVTEDEDGESASDDDTDSENIISEHGEQLLDFVTRLARS